MEETAGKEVRDEGDVWQEIGGIRSGLWLKEVH